MMRRARSVMLFVAGLLAAAGAARAETLVDYRLLVLDGARLKWGAPVLGTGAVVTYAIATAEMRFTGARNCRGIAPPDAMLAGSGVTRPAFERELREAFAAWARVANVRFVPGKVATANIIIGADLGRRGRAFTNVVWAASRGAAHPLTQAVICLNPAERWKVGFDGNLDVYDLRYTLAHEIGHAIGLDHPAVANQLMGFRYREAFAGLQAGDVAGAVTLYGAAGGRLAAAPAVPPATGQVSPSLAIGASADQVAASAD